MPDDGRPYYNHCEQIGGKIRVRSSTALRIQSLVTDLDSSREIKF
jgi:hypothetical protein